MELNEVFRGTEMDTIFFTPVFTDIDIMSQFRVIPNVATKRKIGYVGALEKVVRRHTGCGFDPVGSLNVYDRSVSTEKMKIDLSICWEEFKDTLIEEKFNEGVRMADISELMIVKALVKQASEAAKKDNARLYFFGNEASPDPAYDVMNGLFTVHVPQLVANNDIVRVNQGNAAYNPGDAVEILKELDSKAPKQLYGLPANMKAYYVDGDTYKAYYDDLENINNSAIGTSRMENGVEQLYFRGKKVIPQLEWNDILKNDFGQPNRHYILYTTPKNLALATNTTDTEARFEMMYDQRNEDVIIKTRYKLGGDYVHPSLMSIAY